MKRKKICYIVTIPLTIRSFFLSQLEYLQKNGFDVTVICQKDGSIKAELNSKHIRFIPVNIPRGVSPAGMVKAIFDLTKIFRIKQYDMIQYSTPNAALAAGLAGVFAKIKTRNYHMMGIRYLGFHGIVKTVFKMLEWITCLVSTSVECVSQSNLQMCIHEKLFSQNKGTVVWNGSTGGIDIERFNVIKRNSYRKKTRENLHIGESEFVFGFVGRITKDKGIEELVRAFLKLNRKAKLLLIGEIEESNHLSPDVLDDLKSVPDIILYPFVTDIEKYYAAIDCLVLPSYREGFGNVVMEAGAMGTGAIVSNIPGPKEIIEKIGGNVCNVKDINSLISCMRNFKTMDPQVISDKVNKYYNQEELNQKIYQRKQQLLQNR